MGVSSYRKRAEYGFGEYGFLTWECSKTMVSGPAPHKDPTVIEVTESNPCGLALKSRKLPSAQPGVLFDPFRGQNTSRRQAAVSKSTVSNTELSEFFGAH